MSRLGLDYGTTNTVVVCSDRGRYPVIPHIAETSVGPVAQETLPSLIVRDREAGTFLFGLEAERCLFRPGASERLNYQLSQPRLPGASCCVTDAGYCANWCAPDCRSNRAKRDRPIVDVIGEHCD